jgi:hypothetical protein
MPYKFNVFTGTLDLVNATSSGSGNVTGVPPTDPRAIARWVDNTGTVIENSPSTLVQDSGAIEAQGFISDRQIFGTVSVPTNYTWITDSLEQQPGSVIVMSPGSKIIIL